MNAIVLPKELEAWAEAEVVAGRGESIEQVATNAIRDYRLRMDALRKSLDDAVAESDEKGWLTEEEVFDELEALYPDTE